MRRRTLLAGFPAFALSSRAATAAGRGLPVDALSGSVWDEAASRAGLVDPWIVYAIALCESGVGDGRGNLAPHPWMLGYAGRDVRAATKAEAAGLLAEVMPGTNVDIGLMQVNWAAHHWRVGSAIELLDPERNVRVAGEILRVAMESAAGDLVLGLGRYHSWTEWRARAYGSAVWSLYLSLCGLRSVRRRERLA